MATHGSLKPFNSSKGDWETYEERLQHYFIANDVTDAGKKRSILLTNCDDATFKLLRSLVKDGAVGAATYEELAKLLKDHYQRWHFNTRVRGSGEFIAAYLLLYIALHCDYGDKLSEMRRDRLVCGVNYKGITRKLLSEPDLTYEKALSLALALEKSEKDSKNFGDKQPPPPP